MPKDIEQRIVLSGEKEYSAALKEANRNLRTLRSELKAETAELGKNASEQAKSEAKARSLQKQIAEQEKVVKTLREALEQAKQEYGDNADVIAAWEQKLNNARATLGNMRSDLEAASGGFKNMGSAVQTSGAQAVVASKSFADSLKSIGDAGKNISDKIEGMFSSMVSSISGAVTKVWGLIADTAAKANNWGDLAGIYGTDAQQIQQYSRTLQSLGKDFNTLQQIVTRLAFGGKGQDITEALGISDVNYEDKWEYAMLVMQRMSEMQKEGQNMDPIFEKIFGEKKSTGVIDLLNDWEEIEKRLPEYDGNNGVGMSDEELETMNELSISISTIEAKWDALKDKVAAGLGTLVMPLMVNVEGTIDGITEFLSAGTEEDREKALAKIKANMEEFFRKLGDIIRACLETLKEVGTELQESDDPITRTIGNILVGLTDALDWIVKNQKEVKAAFGAIFGVWLLGKLGAVAGVLTSIIANIDTIRLWNMGGLPAQTTPPVNSAPASAPVTGSDAAAAGNAAAAGGNAAAAGGNAAAATGGTSKIRQFFTSTKAKLAAGTGTFLWAMMPNNPLFSQSGNSEDDAEYQAEMQRQKEEYRASVSADKALEDALRAQAAAEKQAEKLFEAEQTPSLFGQYAGVRQLGYGGYWTPETMQMAQDLLQARFEPDQTKYEGMREYLQGTMPAEDWRLFSSLFDQFMESGRWRTEDRLPLGWWDDQRGGEYSNWYTGGHEATWGRTEGVDWWKQPYTNNGENGLFLLTAEQRKAAENYWDVFRDENATEDEYDAALEQLAAALGENSSVMDALEEKMTELYWSDETQRGLNTDLPGGWFMDADLWRGNGGAGADENGVTAADLRAFNGLPASLREAIKQGAKEGVGGLRVDIDGQSAGRILAPYVSQELARNLE